MSTHKSIDAVCVVVLVFTLLLTVLFINGERFGLRVVTDEDAEGGSAFFTANDLMGDWDSRAATVITLRGDTASVRGGGAYFYNGSVVIANAGRYVLRGTLDDGKIVVDTRKEAKVWLLLDGVTLNCSDDACLRVDQADKVFLTLADGSDNSMTSGETYSPEALADKTDGVIFSHDDLTINGSGSLTITAAFRHGIAANDELVITGGRLHVSAPQDAVHANEGLRVRSAAITAEAGDDALALSAAEALLLLESGSFRLSAAQDGIHSGGEICIAGGSLEIIAGDDGIHSDTGVSLSGGTVLIEECYEGIEAPTIDVSGGEITIYPTDDGLNAGSGSGSFGPFPTAAAETDRETWIHISGGTLTVVNAGARDADGLDSNGDILISGGLIRISLPAGGTNSALDYGSESGGVCSVSGGEIVACGSYSMAESFDASSAQCAVLYNFSEGAEAGTTVSLETLDGRTLLRYTPPCSFSSVALSCPEMRLGETYRVVIGGVAEEITLSETAAAYGNAASAMFGGSMNWGGMPRPGGRPDRRTEDGEAGSGGEQTDRPPEMGGFGGKRPGGAQAFPPSSWPGSDAESRETETAPDTQTDQTPTAFTPGRETWIVVALSALALIGGLGLALCFRPR